MRGSTNASRMPMAITPPLDLFDAFGSEEKTLHANLGGHTGVPSFELDAAARFFARHLT